MTSKLVINKQSIEVKENSNMPLLWFLRDILGLYGTKYSCGIGQCGACTVHLDGKAQRSCLIKLEDAMNKEVTTIEYYQDKIHVIQKAWIALDVPQCGYCQSGQIMSAIALLRAFPEPSNSQIDAYMRGNLCRCGTYQRIRMAIGEASRILKEVNG